MSPAGYLWVAPDRPIAIHLSADVMQRLGMEALEAFKAVPRRGLEIGGILLGHAETDEQVTTLHIEGYQRVESEHRSGPSFRPSEPDLERFDHALARHPNVVGIYRTHTRSESLALEDDDTRLFNRCCAAPGRVFLVIRPASQTAAFFLPNDGALTLAQEFPFHAGDLAVPPAAGASEGVTPAVSARRSETPQPDPAPTPQRRNRWATPAAAMTLGFVLGAAIWIQSRHPAAPSGSPAAAPDGVTLRVQREGPSLHLFWDQGTAPFRGATRATLYIQDGDHNSRLDLDPRELNSGTLSYWPENQDVLFRLEVAAGNRKSEGSIRVVSAGSPAPSPSAPTVAKAPPPSQPAHPPAPVASTPRRPAPPAERRPVADEVADLKPSPFAQVPSKPAQAPAVAAQPTQPEPAAPRQEATVRSLPAPIREPEPRPYVSVSAEPVSSSFLGRVVHKIPLIRRLRKPPQPFVPPRPVRQVRPELTAQEQHSLTEEVPIAVKVYVTGDGKVDYAELLSRESEKNRSLAAAAVYAARRWSFTPARLGEENVSGEVILRFDFRPPSEGR